MFDGVVLRRDDDGYEAGRAAAVWNARLPDRYPDVIVQAVSVSDVSAALAVAASEGLRVGVRSGGHSWAANHVRDGGMLLDVSRLDSVTIDVEAKRAVVGPGKKGHALCAELEQLGLFFPAGHCKGVAVGGYLLQGGYGWNGRVLGPACESVIGIDVVTADGRVLFCDADHHPDLYWAARGSGPGFFGVVTAFHLALYERPNVCGMSVYVYPASCAGEIYRWARAIGPDVDRRVELQILATSSVPALGVDQPALIMASPVFAESDHAAAEAVALLDTCPVRDQAIVAIPFAPAALADWYEAVMTNYPDGHRYAVDNMWTHADGDQLADAMERIIATMPPHPSHVLWLNWGPSPVRQDMAYSMEDEIYIACYGVWHDAADDDRYADWARSNMAEFAGLATGIQLADENLGRRPARFASDANMARLDAVRATYDGGGRFHAWMGRA